MFEGALRLMPQLPNVIGVNKYRPNEELSRIVAGIMQSNAEKRANETQRYAIDERSNAAAQQLNVERDRTAQQTAVAREEIASRAGLAQQELYGKLADSLIESGMTADEAGIGPLMHKLEGNLGLGGVADADVQTSPDGKIVGSGTTGPMANLRDLASKLASGEIDRKTYIQELAKNKNSKMFFHGMSMIDNIQGGSGEDVPGDALVNINKRLDEGEPPDKIVYATGYPSTWVDKAMRSKGAAETLSGDKGVGKKVGQANENILAKYLAGGTKQDDLPFVAAAYTQLNDKARGEISQAQRDELESITENERTTNKKTITNLKADKTKFDEVYAQASQAVSNLKSYGTERETYYKNYEKARDAIQGSIEDKGSELYLTVSDDKYNEKIDKLKRLVEFEKSFSGGNTVSVPVVTKGLGSSYRITGYKRGSYAEAMRVINDIESYLDSSKSQYEEHHLSTHVLGG